MGHWCWENPNYSAFHMEYYEQNAHRNFCSISVLRHTENSHTHTGSQPRSLAYIGPSFAVGFTVLSGMGIAPCIAAGRTKSWLRLRLEIGASKTAFFGLPPRKKKTFFLVTAIVNETEALVSLLSTIHFYRFYGTSKSPNCKICVFTGRPSQGADNYTPDSLQLCDLVLGLFSITAICKMLGRSLCACKHLILVKCDFSSTPLHVPHSSRSRPPSKIGRRSLHWLHLQIHPEF